MAYIASLQKWLIATLLIALAGCATQYDRFKQSISVGQSANEVEQHLINSGIGYRYVTCEEAIIKESTLPKYECLSAESVGMYLGYSNDGSYILGAGSSDVAFEIEIGPDERVTLIRTDNVYTFL